MLPSKLKKGEIVGLLGPNGAGKSTTMRILGGLLSADSGSATVCGLPVADSSLAVKRKIGFMQENNPLARRLKGDGIFKAPCRTERG